MRQLRVYHAVLHSDAELAMPRPFSAHALAAADGVLLLSAFCLQCNNAAAALAPATNSNQRAAPHIHKSSRSRSASSSCVGAARACCSAAGGGADGRLVPASGDRPGGRADQAECSLSDNTGRRTARNASQPQPRALYVWQVRGVCGLPVPGATDVVWLSGAASPVQLSSLLGSA